MTTAILTNREALAQDIETLVMPGQVIAGHADLETDCSSCHKRFDRDAQRQLCMDCHEDVAADIAASAGYHGLHPNASIDTCASCHTEHEGRNADVIVLDESAFDHVATDFELLGSHVEAECLDCHEPDTKYRDAPSDCVSCHLEDEPHGEFMGTDCASCHNSTEWQDAVFDHDTTDFPLVGKHNDPTCLDCHEDQTFQNAPTNCFGCHAEDDAHNGRSGNECETCHNPSDWTDTSFDHSRDTEFELLGKHAELTCDDCHSENPFEDEMNTECSSCHLEDDNHDGHNGMQCDTCHDSSEWATPFFDHDTDTDYRLLGGHREVACIDCHIEPIFEVQLMTDCNSCHQDEDPHEGSLGTLCENCHTEVNWNDPVYFDHDLTSFPLLGNHADNECEDCHESQVFVDTEEDCVSCHLEDDNHDGRFADNCALCHNPVAWDLWLFDHNTQTDFSLAGAHVDVACNGCHRSSLESMQQIGTNCIDCHRSDDIHDGEFGPDCGRCHSDGSFREVRALQ